jgi:hypothetical protein
MKKITFKEFVNEKIIYPDKDYGFDGIKVYLKSGHRNLDRKEQRNAYNAILANDAIIFVDGEKDDNFYPDVNYIKAFELLKKAKYSRKKEIKENFVNEKRKSKYDYEVYHNSFTSAADTARELAEKYGYEVDENSWWSEVATGKYGRSRPEIGKTHKFIVELTKDGKPQRKALHFQVYGMESGKYELNAYVQ